MRCAAAAAAADCATTLACLLKPSNNRAIYTRLCVFMKKKNKDPKDGGEPQEQARPFRPFQRKAVLLLPLGLRQKMRKSRCVFCGFRKKNEGFERDLIMDAEASGSGLH